MVASMRSKIRKYGMSKQRMVSKDALFFHQLLLPMCAPSKSSIPEYGRQTYYTSMMNWNIVMYAIEAKYNSCYGHAFKNPQLDKLVHFDGVVIRGGVKGGRKGVMCQLL
jgi:hypothetical protein